MPAAITRRLALAALSLSLAATTLACDKDEELDDALLADEAMDEDEGEDESQEEEPFAPQLADVAYDYGCPVRGEMRECADGTQQLCDFVDGELEWGECHDDFECVPGELMECEFDEYVGCTIFNGNTYWEECPWTPLVLSFDAAPIEFATSAATFDINGTGACLDSDWPRASTPWLAIDLDRNGSIDGGHELFGSGTVLDTGRRAQHGFAALAPLDHNHDGKIDASDPRFGELLVWRDEDADKRSTMGELTRLADEGVLSISLEVDVAVRCDARANCGRERSSFAFMASGRERVGEVVDVYLACQ